MLTCSKTTIQSNLFRTPTPTNRSDKALEAARQVNLANAHLLQNYDPIQLVPDANSDKPFVKRDVNENIDTEMADKHEEGHMTSVIQNMAFSN